MFRLYTLNILLFLFQKLGKFIPNFNSKYMALRKSSIVNAINSQIIQHLKLYPNFPQYDVSAGIDVISDMDYHKIQYEVLYDDSFKFNVNLIYRDGTIMSTFFLESECENGNPVNDFFNHFKSNPFDFTELFLALNETV